MATSKIYISNDDGLTVEAFAPVIVSASRSTDLPAFYADWFFHRLARGHSVWVNPFNGQRHYISYRDTRFIVFWSKNPHPLIAYLPQLKERNIDCYIQFTLNDYEKELLEPGVPELGKRIDTFKRLVDALGYGRVIWRFDPMILTDHISADLLIDKVAKIGNALNGYTEKLVFSYADILAYRKVKANLERRGVKYQEWTEDEMLSFAKDLMQLNQSQGWNYKLATCGERIDLTQYGIMHNKCIDDDLIIRLAHDDTTLMRYLNAEIVTKELDIFSGQYAPLPTDAIDVSPTAYAIKKRNNADKGQRQFCGCAVSKDIGQYNTCPHICEYCYANSSKATAVANYHKAQAKPYSESILG